MGLVHLPRVFASVGKGLIRGSNSNAKLGIGLQQPPHIYRSRVGLFDYALGHMNNASFLSHAEYARWEMMGTNGMFRGMYESGAWLFVLGTMIRYRRELRPMFQRFQVATQLIGLDDRNLWFVHNFRRKENERAVAQLIVQGALVQKRGITDPVPFLIDKIGFDTELINSLRLPLNEATDESSRMQAMLKRYEDLHESMRNVSTIDDQGRK